MITVAQTLRNFGRLLLGQGMIIGKSRKELDKMRAAGELAAEVREMLRAMVAPNMPTLELNDAAEKMIRDAGAYPTFLNYPVGNLKFPASIITSINEEVVHGIPSAKRILKEGDIVSIDLGVTLDGFIGDTATTVPVGKISAEAQQLIDVTQKSLHLAIEQCRLGRNVGDISYAVQKYAESFGYGLVRGFSGHGIGRKMHEDPQIPNYGKPGTKERIRVGYVFAIEPMVTMGNYDTEILGDGWTVVTKDRSPSAHIEHTVAVTENGPEILTLTKAQKIALTDSKSQAFETVAA